MKPEDQRTLQWLKHLEVKVYRGLHLNAGSIDTNIVDQWLERNDRVTCYLEIFLNHVHLYDFFHGVQGRDELEGLADEIASDWKKVLLDSDPKYQVVKYEGYGPEITFYLDREV